MPCNPIALARRWGAACGIAGIAIAAGIVSAYSEIPSLLITPEVDPHSKIFAESSYPTAATCGQCHTQIYKEWSNSSHAYASISPMFHKFEQTINDLSSGTVRAFCVRCHQQVGTQRGEPRFQALWERSEVSREGITCITCHRITDEFAKVNGQRTVQPGDISRAVTTTGKGSKFSEIMRNREQYHITTNEKEHGTQIHTSIFTLNQLDKPQFCVSCHQVAVQPGIKLEVVWDQYRASPAAEQGITCQDCHMGRVPGIAAGFTRAPTAVVDGKEINPNREHHNHNFYGPGYSIAHPGLFPQNPKSLTTKIEDWLKFDWRSGWGEDAFEDKISDGKSKMSFPKVWADSTDRGDARDIVKENLEGLALKRRLRIQIMENGSHVDGPIFKAHPTLGQDMRFSYRVHNINPGHNMPSGSLGAQPEIWFDVALLGPDGKRVWESGYVDSNGDMADLHSYDVRAGTLPVDNQLVNLQSKFLTTNVVGTDREMYLPVNFDIDQLPFIRPNGVPQTVLNHPPFIRMEQRSIPPLGFRDADYYVPGNLLTAPGTYKLAFRMRERAEPIYFMDFVKATTEMKQAMNQGMIDIHPFTVSFEIK
ncbi:MAG TPA: multiheme c-type cytochrome [Xanthobacteraceae bacterium]|jgi:nitrate/TMAO reductase-like tetraheme cytochrome c subunit|nr:multiheme c-type cytochrome [Xanthobacteraceae bacterium]